MGTPPSMELVDCSDLGFIGGGLDLEVLQGAVTSIRPKSSGHKR